MGGHSAEGSELGLAFSVTGTLTDPPLAKGGLAVGQSLVLTGAIGTGTVLAGAMQGRTRAEHLLAAIEQMDSSNARAAEVLRAHGATACTDVTGFGLVGHLSEMVRASGTGARVRAGSVPVLDGALDLMAAGIASSLQPNNELALTDYEVTGVAPNAPVVRLLADPQTAGGLLAGVPQPAADDCVRQLRAEGYPAAAIIGDVTRGEMEVVA